MIEKQGMRCLSMLQWDMWKSEAPTVLSVTSKMIGIMIMTLMMIQTFGGK